MARYPYNIHSYLIVPKLEIIIIHDTCSQSFQPKETNPPQLNAFLSNVMQHENAFQLVRETAQKFQKIKKDTQWAESPEQFRNDDQDLVEIKYRTRFL